MQRGRYVRKSGSRDAYNFRLTMPGVEDRPLGAWRADMIKNLLFLVLLPFEPSQISGVISISYELSD